MSREAEGQPATPLDRAHMLARGLAMVAAAIPSTVLVPLPVTQLFTKRFQREERLRDFHFMVAWARFCTERILGIRLDVQGQQNLPRPSRGHMYVSNHQSYTDIVVLMTALDTVAFLSKRVPVRYIPLVGRAAYCGGTVYIDRGSKESREQALQETIRMCEESTAVVVFPEGTRSADGELREKIHPRAMQVARQRGIKLVPVALHGTWRVIPKSMDRVRTGQPVALRIGEILDPAAFDSDASYADACWAAVGELHEQARAAVAAKP
jgi:1-acyl-sn-glycerol-3-phosphate acyltransferase